MGQMTPMPFHAKNPFNFHDLEILNNGPLTIKLEPEGVIKMLSNSDG